MKKRHVIGLISVGAIGAWAAACGGGGGTSNMDDAGNTILPDGGVLLPDGNVISTGDAGSDDATMLGLDVALPDGFGSLDGGNAMDATMVIDSGCSPSGITCQGVNPELSIQCDGMGNLTSTNCTMLGKTCAPGFGCVACIPGTGSCNGNTATRCLPDGSGTIQEYCDPLMGLSCSSGVCLGACSSGNLGQSYIGCEYYAITMVNDQLSQGTFPFAVSISNTSQQSASVNIQGPGNYNSTFNVAAGAVVTQNLPWVSSLSLSVGTSKVTGGAYHIRSTQPITVYQFNPKDYQIGFSNSYTNDASLLLPVNAMTGNYYAHAWPTWRTPSNFVDVSLPGTIAIVGTAANTTVKFTPPNNNNVQAGGGVSASGTSTVTLNAGDVLQIASAVPGPSRGSYGSDMSGSTIAADKPVEVFGGHDCTFVPANVGYCDHLEEVVFPQETLREDYLVVPPYNSLGQPRAYVKIIATTANTNLTYNPPNVGGPASLANAGQVGTFLASVPFEVTANANHPILISMTMLGEDNFQAGNPNAGDPAHTTAVAILQYRKDYKFFAPPNYAQNWVTVTGPLNAVIAVDGVNVGALTQIGNSAYGYKHVSLCANNSCNGVHSASSATPFGIQVYGYGSYTSYWYPGGLDLKR